MSVRFPFVDKSIYRTSKHPGGSLATTTCNNQTVSVILPQATFGKFLQNKSRGTRHKMTYLTSKHDKNGNFRIIISTDLQYVPATSNVTALREQAAPKYELLFSIKPEQLFQWLVKKTLQAVAS